MAISVPSSASTGFTATSVVITKPASLAVGDLMIASLSASGGSAITITTLSGWTLGPTSAGSNCRAEIQYKIADSGDVAASNFTFTASSGNIAGSILRVSGHNATTPLENSDADFNNAASSADVSFTTNLTPTFNGSLLVEVFVENGGNDGGTTTTSGYSISGTNPTWTESLDTAIDSGTSDPAGAAAYAIQTTAANFTSYGATLSNAKTVHAGVIAIFGPKVDITVSPAVQSIVASIQAPTPASSFVISSPVTETASIQAPTVTTAGAKWTTPNKSSSTWDNQNKTV